MLVAVGRATLEPLDLGGALPGSRPRHLATGPHLSFGTPLPLSTLLSLAAGIWAGFPCAHGTRGISSATCGCSMRPYLRALSPPTCSILWPVLLLPLQLCHLAFCSPACCSKSLPVRSPRMVLLNRVLPVCSALKSQLEHHFLGGESPLNPLPAGGAPVSPVSATITLPVSVVHVAEGPCFPLVHPGAPGVPVLLTTRCGPTLCLTPRQRCQAWKGP